MAYANMASTLGDDIKLGGSMRTIEQLREDMVKVLQWRGLGKALTPEQETFANNVVDEMIAMKTAKQTGVQLVSKSHIEFIKGMQPIQGSDAVGGIVQDVVSNTQTQDGKFPRKLATKSRTESPDVAKADITGCKCKELPISGAETGTEPRKTPDAENIKLNPPENQTEGAVTATADITDDARQPETTDEANVPADAIGHNPNEPMPKSQATDLINNAKWGVEIGAYTNIKEGIDRLLSRKEYEEFIDTPEKLKSVTAFLTGLIAEVEPVPVAPKE